MCKPKVWRIAADAERFKFAMLLGLLLLDAVNGADLDRFGVSKESHYSSLAISVAFGL